MEAMGEALVKELDWKISAASGGVSTLYFGGGTPSLFSLEALGKLVERCIAAGGSPSEITLEANPEDITPERLQAWLSMGVNRLSIGVQTFDDNRLQWTLALAVLAVVMMSNSLSTVDIVNQQTGAGVLSWNIWRQPVGFLIFWICALAECERLPFDLPEAEEELVAGYQTEYSGMKFALFYLGSYINLVLSALLVSILYLGGWGFPIPVEWLASWLGQPIDAPLVQLITGTVGIVMTVLKAYLLVFIAILLRWTTPRVRIDQLLDLGWKFLLPLALVNLLVTAALKLAFPIAFGG